MGDRNNPIKFGPEWLRNLPLERNEGRSPYTRQNTSSGQGAGSPAGASGGSGGGTATCNIATGSGSAATPTTSEPTAHNAAVVNSNAATSTAIAATSSSNGATANSSGMLQSRVLLARLRYGREEMLALYDRNASAPPELKNIDTLYQPRGKVPFALNNTFEDDMRDNLRNAPLAGGMSQSDRYGMGRGMGRGGNGDTRGRTRGYIRPPIGRGTPWNTYSPRLMYSGSANDDDGGPSRSWNNNSANNRNSGDQSEFLSRMFKRRQGPNTNWRQQQSRDEAEEWRSSGAEAAGRPRQGEKWEREYRSSGEKQQSWSTNRRSWVGGDTQNNEEIPEWVGENAECGGTFDSSGAFHGYSNDDTNLPKHKESASAFPLSKSHTHGSFARSKTAEEGSEEWWASDKAKKLSPKRFNASDIKFNKKQPSIGVAEAGPTASTSKEYSNKTNYGKDDYLQDVPEKLESTAAPQEQQESNNISQNEETVTYKSKFTESKTFDAMMRSDINMDEANDERGNFQSVIITPNNSLRQKHQHLVSASEGPNKGSSSSGQNNKGSSSKNVKPDMDHGRHDCPDQLIGGIFSMEQKEMIPTPQPHSLLTLTNTHNTALVSPTSTKPPNIQMNITNQGLQMDGNYSHQNMQGSGMQGSVMPGSGLQGSGMQGSGMQGSGMQGSGMQGSGMQGSGMQGSGMQGSGMQVSGMQGSGMQGSGMQGSGMQGSGMKGSGMQGSGMQGSGMQGSGMQGSSMQASNMQGSTMQASNMQGSAHQMHGMQAGRHSGIQHGMPSPGIQQSNPNGMQQSLQSSGQQGKTMHNPGMAQLGMQASSMQNQGLHSVMQMPAGLQNPGNPVAPPRGQNPVMQSSLMQPLGISNSALNASLGLPRLPNIGMPRLPEGYTNVSNDGMGATLDAAGIQSAMSMQVGNLPGFHTGAGISGMTNTNLNNSLFLAQTNNTAITPPGEIPMPTHGNAGQNMFPMHGHTGSQASAGFGNSLYNNSNNIPNPSDKWFYEDPKGNIQGPFSSKEMFNWYRAGFFSSTLMVRRSYETVMRPLGSYPGVPFAHMDILPPFPCFEPRARRRSDAMLNSQAVMKMNMPDNHPVETLQFGSVGQMAIQSFNPPQPMVDLLWGQPSEDLMWMQQPLSARNEGRVNNLPMYFWERQPSAISSNSLLPEEITKEMKTEDQILAQLRASQNIPQPPSLPFREQLPTTPVVTTIPDDCFAAAINATPNLEELHRLIQKDTLSGNTLVPEPEIVESQAKTEKAVKQEPTVPEIPVTKTQTGAKAAPEPKPAKQKVETEKAAKNKENNTTKTKAKKTKDEKKDEVVEVKTKDDEVNKAEKRSQEPSPTKNKKEDKSNKKELEKEKKEWIKEGFTIVKGPEKTTSKDGKKKAEEARVAEEAERKRKEEEKLAADEEKKNKKKQVEALKKQQEVQQQQRQASESVAKKAPWSAIANLTLQAVQKDGPTLADIQRLEREKKLEQMKEQQQMMQIIAQQQAAALAREQEMQAGLGWAKMKANSFNAPGQSLAEIQAEARKQAAVAAAVAQAQSFVEEAQAALPLPINNTPWSNSHNGGGFWDTQPNQPPKVEKPQEPAKPAEPAKIKKKLTLSVPAKKETSPAAEFETWCTTFLSPWCAKIDVPTFVGFLKDIESPYEVKDYVKCYIGDSKESNDFARQFLERRSKLLRVGMVTPSDDLCSPAIAVNPRTTSGSEYQEIKGKGKKTKKNKMLKVDARILGFSVTAAEDRINVGDIDTV